MSKWNAINTGIWLSSEDHPQFDYVDFDNTNVVNPDPIKGRVYWDEANKTLSVAMNDHVILQVGQEMHIYGVNKDSINLVNGTVVSITGAQGNRPKFARADGTNIQSTDAVLGMLTEDILKNQEGYISTVGTVRNLNTESYTVGQILYLDPTTPGGLTAIEPMYPNYCLEVGIVLVSHNNQGEIQLTLRRDYSAGDIVQTNANGTAKDLHIITGTEKTVVYDTSTWDDLPPNPIIRSRLSAANNPTLTSFVNNIQQYTFSLNDFVVDNQEILHSYKQGTNLKAHIHWATNGSDTNVRYVNWQLEYTICNASGDLASASSFPTVTVISSEEMIPANTPTRSHVITGIGDIDGTNLRIGAVLIYNIKRIAAVSGAEPSNNPFGLQLACHIQQDTQGSRQLFIK